MHSEKCNKHGESCAFMKHIMEKFENIERKCSSNLFIVAHTRENRFSPDTQHRPRKSPRKKLKATRTSTSLVIEQLKSGFRRSGDFAQRTRRNWRPEFLIKYLWDSCKEESSVAAKHRCGKSCRSRNLVPQTPKICSIGLRLGARSLSDGNDLSGSFGMIRNLKKRFNIVRRPAFICKYWTAHREAPLRSTIEKHHSSTDMFLKAHKSHQSMLTDPLESNIFKHGEITNGVDRLHSKDRVEDASGSLRDNCAAGDRFYVPDASDNPSAEKDTTSDKIYVKRKDAQIQTSGKKRRKKPTKKRPKPMSEKSSYFDAECCNSNKIKHCDRSRLSVRVPANKRPEYIDKFTAVSRQIEEITATLRETCYNDTNSENNDKNCASVINDATRKTEEKREPHDEAMNGIAAAQKWSTVKRKTRVLTNVRKVNEETKNNNRRHRNINDFSMGSDTDLNDGVLHAFAIKRTVRSSNGTGNTQKCRLVRQISFDLDLTKNDDEFREFSLQENESFDQIHLGNTNFVASSEDKRYARDYVKSFGFEKSKIVREKTGETIILKDIKRRIDRDFDEPTDERSEENNTDEEFLVTPVKSGGSSRSCCKLIQPDDDARREKTIGEIRSTSLLVPADPDATEMTRVRDTKSPGSMSEYSNQTSTLSKYFSCTRLSSLASLEEHAIHPTVIVNDSRSNLNSNCCDLDLDASNIEFPNLDAIVDRSDSDYVARYNTANKQQCVSMGEFPIGTIISETSDETRDAERHRRALAKNPTRDTNFLAGRGSGEEGNNSRVDKRHDSTFETSKHNIVGSIDSGVFSSSLIDLCPPESSSFLSARKSELEKKKRCDDRKLGDKSSSPIFDFSTDSSCTDDTLDRQVDDVVRDLTKNLILCERRARVRLKEMRGTATGARKDVRCSRYTLSHVCKFSRRIYDTCHNFFTSPRRFSEDERIVSVSTPSLLSLSDSENEDITR